MSKPVVAIVGRPNVGKSTFFNRCIGGRHAIVDDTPGVTRDRIYHETDWSGHDFLIIDTGGIVPNSPESMAGQIEEQVRQAVAEADVIVFMVDGKAGLAGSDQDVANMLRRTKKPIVLAVNKIDTPNEEQNILEFYGLGIGDPQPLSAMRGTGAVGDLLDKIIEHFPEREKKGDESIDGLNGELSESQEPDLSEPTAIAIIGRPNVGKSSLVNVLCGKSRSIVSAEPGTTRDAIDTTIKHQGRELKLIDTAGIRRKNKVDYGIEAFSVVRSIKAIDRADVVILIIDASQPISDQDQKIATKIEEAGKAVVIVFNKWDLVEDRSSGGMKKFLDEVNSELRHLSYAEVVFTSALTKQRVFKVIEAAERARSETCRRIGTGLVNQVIAEAVAMVPPPSSKRGKRMKIYYTTQVSVAPPTFILFVNDDKLATKSYETYLERKLREAFGFKGTPIRIFMRAKKDNR